MADEHYQVLARTWRPQAFDEVVGQQHITRTLQNAIENHRIGHAYLFIGSRGIGKTTTARILAKALNCLSVDSPTPTPCGKCENCTSIAAGRNIDVLEIDGASNNSVEDVRQIRDNVRLVPSNSRYKIYVIDEVHQLSSSAFNALLKTLEEPPEHAVFILATTEAHKVPATIISRCQRYDFRRVGHEDICTLLRQILKKEEVTCSEEALVAIARAADGGVRDAESILEQLISYCGKEITFKDVFEVLGLVDWGLLNELCDALLEQDIATQLRIVEDIVASGKDLSQFVQDIIQYFRNLLVCKTADAKTLLALPEHELAPMQERAQRFSLTRLIQLIEQFAELSKNFDSQLAQRIALETLLIRSSKIAVEMSVDTVLEKLAQLGAGDMGQNAALAAAPPQKRAQQKTGSSSPPRQAPGPRKAPAQSSGSDHPPEPGRVTVTGDNLPELWKRIAERASDENLNIGLSLSQAQPAAIENSTVILEFPHEHRNARESLERSENRGIVEKILQAATHNVTTYQTILKTSAATPPTRSDAETKPPSPVGAGVSPELVNKALENPHIAKVVDVFKGRIIDVKHHIKEDSKPVP
ncbi:MAG: DNA polymerase III subunit gamma/tau [Candidatus Hydrogenedentota bacterium]